MTTFTHHCAVVTVPRLVTAEPVRVNRALLCGNREQVDAYADAMVARERRMDRSKSAGAVATFHLFRSQNMEAHEAHQVIRKWCNEHRSQFAPNPLCMATRRDLSEHYARPGHYTGD